MRILTMATLTVAALTCGAAYAAADTGPAAEGHATVSVVGTGIATGTPDMASLTVSVDVTKPTVAEASDAAATAAQAMLAAIKGQGVADGDITTAGLSLSQVTAYDPSTGPHVTGYDAGESFCVKIRAIGHTAAVVQAAAGAAGNGGRVGSVTFDLADRKVLRAQARDQAVADAQAAASQYATDTGHTLGKLLSLSEQARGNGPVFPPPLPPGAVAGPPPPIAPPIATGQVQENVSVAAVYELD